MGHLTAEGEMIDPATDASTTPETFTPQCALTFKVVARDAGFNNSFGWYNVTGSKPAVADLNEFLTCSDGVGTVKQLDIRNDPRWAGGDIAFYQATPENAPGNCPDVSNPSSIGYIFFSEKSYNPDNTGPNSFIHLMIMDSKVANNTFYFAWEDLFAGGDNDFTDLVTRVEGISCTGGGEACDTGQLGLCAFGATQCVNGQLECVQQQQPGVETCNAVDDDCNGQIDDGDLCQDDWICDRGVCRPPCGSGEFVCQQPLVCDPDTKLCSDPACIGKDCPAETTCVQGECVGACDGVTCPFGQVCRAGTCADPCAGVTCEADQVCDFGVCVTKCQCAGCDTPNTGKVCDDATSRCVPDGCQGVTCNAGTHCEGGQCVDDCMGAVCPTGETCSMGMCVEDPNATGGASSGGTGAMSGIGGGLIGGAGGTGGTLVTGGASGSGATAAGPGLTGGTETADDGCGCRVVGERESGTEGVIGRLSELLGLVGTR